MPVRELPSFCFCVYVVVSTLVFPRSWAVSVHERSSRHRPCFFHGTYRVLSLSTIPQLNHTMAVEFGKSCSRLSPAGRWNCWYRAINQSIQSTVHAGRARALRILQVFLFCKYLVQLFMVRTSSRFVFFRILDRDTIDTRHTISLTHAQLTSPHRDEK